MPPGEVPPAQYGQPGQPGDVPLPPGESGGRFGYTGGGQAQAPPAPPAPGGQRDVTNIEPQPPAPQTQTPPDPPKPEKPATPAMTFANPVPGNPLVVTLPGKHSSLGQISIEKYDSAGNPTGEPMKRGTQVQIPDPTSPGQKIYFKVP